MQPKESGKYERHSTTPSKEIEAEFTRRKISSKESISFIKRTSGFERDFHI